MPCHPARLAVTPQQRKAHAPPHASPGAGPQGRSAPMPKRGQIAHARRCQNIDFVPETFFDGVGSV